MRASSAVRGSRGRTIGDRYAHRVDSTQGSDYTERLQTLEAPLWKRVLDVQAPYRRKIQSWKLGKTLDVGCGIGRCLAYLDPTSVGVDHNESSIAVARSRGLTAFTSDEFTATDYAKPKTFDSMLAAHLVEHLSEELARTVIESYVPYVKPGGRVVFITPQERGYASDPTHVRFCGYAEVEQLVKDVGLTVVQRGSFPFPRAAGRVFPYNEFHVIATVNDR